MFDARSVANLLLDIADQHQIAISNLALQKLVFFAHGLYLVRTGRPLVSGYFEAWEHGPVHPKLYREFKKFGAAPITSRAMAVDLRTDSPKLVATVSDAEVCALVARTVLSYGTMSPGRLVQISHARKGPWWQVVESAKHDPARGLRITDDIVREHFKNHKVSVREDLLKREPDEDTPIARYRDS